MSAGAGSGPRFEHGPEPARSRWTERLVRLVLAGAAILFVLGAFEVALRTLGYEPIYAVYSHPEVFWRRDPMLGWSLEPNAEGTYIGPRPWPVEFEAPVRINSLGLRGPEIGPIPTDGVRVMMLGDSVVAGFEVPWEQTFPALVESRLAAEFEFPVQVINAAVRGYGADQSFLYYRDRGHRLAPDFVVFIPSQNDVADNVTLHRMRRIFGKGALVPRADGTLETVGVPIPDYPICSEWIVDAEFRPRRVDTAFERAMCGVQTRLADRSALFTFFSLRIRQNQRILEFLYRLGSPGGSAERLGIGADGSATRNDVAPREQVNVAILNALAREVRQHGAELLLPVRSCFAELDARDFASEAVVTFEITEALCQPEFHYRRDGHLNPRGHELMARELGAILARRIRARRSDVSTSRGAGVPQTRSGTLRTH